ncbi:MAG: dienelactone hydrolase family protein [Halofilum sp. (in: g-proteobacteria)]
MIPTPVRRLACALGTCGTLLGAAPAAAEAFDPLYQRLVFADHREDRPVRNVAGVEREVSTRTAQYATFDDRPVRGYMARPAAAEKPTPGVLVIHEWWGLNDNIRALSRRLAANGYTALAVDLYAGETAETSEQARSLLERAMRDEQRLRRNLREAVDYLDVMPSTTRVGSIGWHFGGGWSLRSALMFPDPLDAAVIYYGEPVTDKAELEALSAPVLGHFGAEGSSISIKHVRAFEAALTELEKAHEIHLYEGAGHAFDDPAGTRNVAESAGLAWRRTLDFLERTLQPESEDGADPETEIAVDDSAPTSG